MTVLYILCLNQTRSDMEFPLQINQTSVYIFADVELQMNSDNISIRVSRVVCQKADSAVLRIFQSDFVKLCLPEM